MLRGLPASRAARTVALLAVACVSSVQGAPALAQRTVAQGAPATVQRTSAQGAPTPVRSVAHAAAQDPAREFADLAGSGVRGGLPTVRWVIEHADERRIDVYAFDCARRRYAHVVSERHRGPVRIERIALAEERWATALLPLPPKYPVLAVHRAQGIACAPAGRAR